MRNGIKKICGLILMSALIWIAAAATAVTATSRSVADATPTALDTAVEASISDSGEEDWYYFTIPSDGYIYTTFSHGFIDNNKKYWKMWILNADGGEYYYSDNFIGNRVSPVESCRIGLPAGTYYLKIAGFRNNQWSDQNYSVSVHFTASDRWEKEYNNNIMESNSIAINTAYSGSVRHSGDVDYYSFSIPKSGYVYIAFNHDYVDSGDDLWKVQLLNIDSYNYLRGDWGFQGKTLTEATTTRVGLPAGVYYVRISGGWFSGTYTFRVDYADDSSWETEINDTVGSADHIHPGSAVSGIIQGHYDADCFAVDIEKPGEYLFDFTHDYQGPTTGFFSFNKFWNVELLDSSNVKLQSWNYQGDILSGVTKKVFLQEGRYYVKVQRYSDGLFIVSSTVTYRFVLNKVVPPEVTVVTVDGGVYKLSKGTATLTGPEKKNQTVLTIPAVVNANEKTYKVTAIAANACKEMSNLTKLTIGKNVTKIGKNAFYKCRKLKTIIIKASGLQKTGIGKDCFKTIAAKPTFKCPTKQKKHYKKWLVQIGGAPKKAAFK